MTSTIAIEVFDEPPHSESLESKRLRARVHVSILALCGLGWLVVAIGSLARYRWSEIITVSRIDGLVWILNLTYVSIMCLRFLQEVQNRETTGHNLTENWHEGVDIADQMTRESTQLITVVGDVCVNGLGVVLLFYTVSHKVLFVIDWTMEAP